jgi:hypothetical protein
MKARDPHADALGPRVKAWEPSLDRVVTLRRTFDGRVPGHGAFRPIYHRDSSRFGELGPVTWYRNWQPGDHPGTWTVCTNVLCGAFHYEKAAVVDDFGTLVVPEVVGQELASAAHRRALRGIA